MLAVAHAGRGGRSASSWVAGCAGLDDRYAEWATEACRSRSVTRWGLTAPVSDGWAPRLAGPRFLHRFYMIPDHDRYTW